MIKTWRTKEKKWFQPSNKRHTVNEYIYIEVNFPRQGNTGFFANGRYFTIIDGQKIILPDSEFRSFISFEQAKEVEDNLIQQDFTNTRNIVEALKERTIQFTLLQIEKEHLEDPDENNYGISSADLEDWVEPEPEPEPIEEEEEQTNTED